VNAQTPAWQRYVPTVLGLLPSCDEAECRVRASIMHIRDQANRARHKGVSWAADQILSTIEQLGLASATAEQPAHELNAVRANMAELFRIAASLDVLGRAQ